MVNIHRAFSGFLRGQVIIALLGGLGTGLLMSIFHVDYALLTSVVASVMLLIPFIGPVLAVCLPVIIALFTNSDAVWIVLIGLVALQQILFQLDRAAHLQHAGRACTRWRCSPPCSTGSRLAGIWGAVFGVPVLAVLLSMYSFYRASQEERAARLHEELPGQELVSVEPIGPIPLSGQRKERRRS